MEGWVVVVDDEPLNLTHIRSILAGEKTRVTCLRSGGELLRFIQKSEPDVILLDVIMPEMDGFETYRRLRIFEEQNERNEIPVIFLTGDKDTETEHKGLKLGASDFIHKPFDKDILIRRIDNTIQNNRRIESLMEEATTDGLTGFLNKAGGKRKLQDSCEMSCGMLMILDLDNFKLVNDIFGHDMGDRVLLAFSDVVRRNFRGGDIISRIGGDEFAAFIGDMPDEWAVSAFTARLNRDLLAEANRLMGEEFGIPLGISVGAVKVPEYGRDYDVLLELADETLYKAKQNGKHCGLAYSDAFIKESDTLDIKADLSRITKIITERNEGREAFILGTDAFAAVYNFVIRFNKRYDAKALKLLFVIEPAPEDRASLDRIMDSFGDVLKASLRRSDVIMKNRGDQYFLLLPMMEESDSDGVVNRILGNWTGSPESTCCKVSYAKEIC